MRIADMFETVLQESPAKQESLEQIASYLISKAAGAAVTRLRSQLADGWEIDHIDPHDMGGTTLREMPRSIIKTFDKDCQAFVKASQTRWLVMRFQERRKTSRFRGLYTPAGPGKQPEITIYIDENDFRQMCDLLARDHLTFYSMLPLLASRRDTLVHELRHAYEDWASQGRWLDNARSIAATDAERAARSAKDDPEKRRTADKLYLNDPVEISARYSQTVFNIEPRRTASSWPEYRRLFQYEFAGWKEVPAAEQRRLLTRLAVQWQADRQMAKPDVAGAVTRLQQRLGSAARVRLGLNGKAIEVEDVQVKAPEAITALLKPIVLLADHYGLTVALADKLPIPAVRPLKFQNQRPRSVNGGLRDYSLPRGTVYLRRPVQRRASI